MIRYLNGVILTTFVPEEKTLLITVSDEEGQPLAENMDYILDGYGKHISCFGLSGDTENLNELINIFKTARKKGLKTFWRSQITKLANLNPKLSDELDYILVEGSVMRKEYSPFGDAEVWISV